MEVPAVDRTAWHQTLDAKQWRVLIAAFLGWIFNGYETYALFLVMSPVLRQLLEPEQLANLSSYAGMLVAATLLGWATGGVLGGIVADYIGRKRTMIITILIYASFVGLTSMAQSWTQLLALRFLTGLGLGGEWVTGATLIAESWSPKARAKGAGMMQSAFGWGSFLAAGVWYFLEPAAGPAAWRWLFVLGATPALFVPYIQWKVQESERWLEKHRQRGDLRHRRRSGVPLTAQETILTAFTVKALFSDPALRRLVLLCLVMSLASTVGYWAVSTWIPAYTEAAAGAAGVESPARWGAVAGLLYNAGAIWGYLAAGFLADWIGRRPLLVCFFAGSLVTTPVVYLWSHSPAAIVVAAAVNGVFTLGQFAWMAIYPPELFPTALRATAVSIIFNTTRFLSFLGPLFAGLLITRLGGYGTTALLFSLTYLFAICAVPFLPETKGKPLPE
ncbi:MAG: MFS transporter [Acidobacteria bacterium]|nr:MFS transporter [Acidobacteriota bacterium]